MEVVVDHRRADADAFRLGRSKGQGRESIEVLAPVVKAAEHVAARLFGGERIGPQPGGVGAHGLVAEVERSHWEGHDAEGADERASFSAAAVSGQPWQRRSGVAASRPTQSHIV